MLFKLLKYDFRAMWKQFSLVWGAALVMALVNRFTIYETVYGLPSGPLMGENVSNLTILTFGAVLVAMFVIAVMFVINRFSRGLLGSEGYLMHTLPVRSWQLVLSKLICGAVTWVGCGVVALLSPVFMLPWNLPDLIQLSFWRDISRGILKHPQVLVLMAEFCMVIFSFLVLLISVMYLSMSIGHLFARRRKLISVAAYIGLYILLANVYGHVFSYGFVQYLLDVSTTTAYGSMLAASATMLIPAAVFLAAVCWILDNKLNLE